MAIPIFVRQVWQHNLAFEFHLIQTSLSRFCYIAMDTEFPGTVYPLSGRHYSSIPPSEFYANMKKNVDASKLIQLGLTLCDSRGNLPSFGTTVRYIWEFNFRDFDSDHDLHDPESVTLLRRQGIDFAKNRAQGIDSRHFAYLFKYLNLGIRAGFGQVKWITFHGPYDFGYLIKILIEKELPGNLKEFKDMVQIYFGKEVYDLKILIQVMNMGLHGGLDRIGRSLNLNSVGKSHLAAPDSLLTMQVFFHLKNEEMKNFSQLIYGIS